MLAAANAVDLCEKTLSEDVSVSFTVEQTACDLDSMGPVLRSAPSSPIALAAGTTDTTTGPDADAGTGGDDEPSEGEPSDG